MIDKGRLYVYADYIGPEIRTEYDVITKQEITRIDYYNDLNRFGLDVVGEINDRMYDPINMAIKHMIYPPVYPKLSLWQKLKRGIRKFLN